MATCNSQFVFHDCLRALSHVSLSLLIFMFISLCSLVPSLYLFLFVSRSAARQLTDCPSLSVYVVVAVLFPLFLVLPSYPWYILFFPVKPPPYLCLLFPTFPSASSFCSFLCLTPLSLSPLSLLSFPAPFPHLPSAGHSLRLHFPLWHRSLTLLLLC